MERGKHKFSLLAISTANSLFTEVCMNAKHSQSLWLCLPRGPLKHKHPARVNVERFHFSVGKLNHFQIKWKTWNKTLVHWDWSGFNPSLYVYASLVWRAFWWKTFRSTLYVWIFPTCILSYRSLQMAAGPLSGLLNQCWPLQQSTINTIKETNKTHFSCTSVQVSHLYHYLACCGFCLNVEFPNSILLWMNHFSNVFCPF